MGRWRVSKKQGSIFVSISPPPPLSLSLSLSVSLHLPSLSLIPIPFLFIPCHSFFFMHFFFSENELSASLLPRHDVRESCYQNYDYFGILIIMIIINKNNEMICFFPPKDVVRNISIVAWVID